MSNLISNFNTNLTDSDKFFNFNSTLFKSIDRIDNHREIFKEKDRNNLNFKDGMKNHRETFNENMQNSTLTLKHLQPVYVKDWRNYNSSTNRSIMYPNNFSTREVKRQT